MKVSPTTFLEQKLVPVSKEIDKFGGPNVIMGLIASGGQPHVFITGNVKGAMKIEIYEALADKLRQVASELRRNQSAIIQNPSLTLV